MSEKIKVIEMDNGTVKRICRSRSEAKRIARMNPDKWPRGRNGTVLTLKRVTRQKLEKQTPNDYE